MATASPATTLQGDTPVRSRGARSLRMALRSVQNIPLLGLSCAGSRRGPAAPDFPRRSSLSAAEGRPTVPVSMLPPKPPFHFWSFRIAIELGDDFDLSNDGIGEHSSLLGARLPLRLPSRRRRQTPMATSNGSAVDIWRAPRRGTAAAPGERFESLAGRLLARGKHLGELPPTY
jgi:hypothetical protein